MVTMTDVARHAGVSTMTVSNVVNGHPQVSEATRAKVTRSLTELGYSVNTAARNLRQGRTGVIGLAVPDLNHPYFSMLARMVVERAAVAGYEVVVEQTGQLREGDASVIARSRQRRYDGLILHTSTLADQDSAILRGDYPIVVLGERAYNEPVDHVAMGNVRGADLAASHLLDRGCQHIAMLGGRPGDESDSDVSTLRARGFLDAFAARDRTPRLELIVEMVLGMEEGRVATHALLDEYPEVDGIFAATDEVAIGALRALFERGVPVPGQVKVVGFDALPMSAFTAPSLTTVAPDHLGIIEHTLGLLIGRLTGNRPSGQYEEIVSNVELIVRESSGVAPQA